MGIMNLKQSNLQSAVKLGQALQARAIHLCPECLCSKTNKLRQTASVFYSRAGPNGVRTSFLQFKLRDNIRPIHNMTLIFTSNTLLNFKVRVMLFIQLQDQPVRIDFAVAVNFLILLLVGTSVIDRSFKRVLLMNRRVVPIPSSAVTIIAKYTPLSNQWLYS